MANSQDLLESALDVSGVLGDKQAFTYLYAAFQVEPWNMHHCINCAIAIFRIVTAQETTVQWEEVVSAVRFALDCFRWAEQKDPLDALLASNVDVREALESMLGLTVAEEFGRNPLTMPPQLETMHRIPNAEAMHVWHANSPLNHGGWDLYSEGCVLFAAGWYEEAAIYFLGATMESAGGPASCIFYAELGLAHMLTGNYAAAHIAFSTAIDHVPNFYNDVFVLGPSSPFLHLLN